MGKYTTVQKVAEAVLAIYKNLTVTGAKGILGTQVEDITKDKVYIDSAWGWSNTETIEYLKNHPDEFVEDTDGESTN